MSSGLPENIYTAESQLRTPWKLIATMLADLRKSRFLAWRLFVRNMSAQHRQTLLGYFWLLIVPVIQTLLWVFLNSQKVINVGATEIPYPAFVLTGTLLWQGFVEAVQAPMQQIHASKQMLSKIRFPHEAIILAAMGQVIVNFSIRLGLVVIVYLVYGLSLTASLLFVPLGILVIIGFGVMLSLLLTPLSLLYEDVQRMLGMALSLWFFVTPVIYPAPSSGWAALVTTLNPVTPLMMTTRQWLTGTEPTHLLSFGLVASISLVLALFGWLVYRLAMPYLIERIGS